jgi:hypothetical protein
MVRRWDLAMVEKGMACASLCVGSMRDQVSMRAYGSMRDCVVALCEFPCLGDVLGGFIYAAS